MGRDDREAIRVGYASSKLRPDAIHHPVDVIAHVLIGEAYGFKALAKKYSVAGPVVFNTGFVGSAIHLDDKARPDTDEVEKIAAEWSLPAKWKALGP